MAYLTIDEYKSYRPNEELPENIEKVIEMASAVLDAETRYFYAVNNIDDDYVVFRAKQFKLALVLQIDFFIANGFTSLEEYNGQPDSVSIGDTTVSYNRNIASANSSQRTSALSLDAKNLLASIGLLYRGGKNV